MGIGVAEDPPLFFNNDGTPVTNTNKSSFKAAVMRRYGENNFFYVQPKNTENRAVFIDGMPALFVSPTMGLTTFGSYIQFLIKRKVEPHFEEANEVHIVFDCPSIWGFNLKKGVQQKRDVAKKQMDPLGTEISENTKVPSSSKWSSFLANREDKQNLVYLIGKQLLLAKEWLKPGQTLIAGGCFHDNETYAISSDKAIRVEDLN